MIIRIVLFNAVFNCNMFLNRLSLTDDQKE